MRKLTNKQEAFAQAIADGMDQSKAYHSAYAVKTNNRFTVTRKAHEIAHLGHVANRIAELKGQLADSKLLNRLRKREILCDVAEDVEQPAQNRIKAIEADNRMTGDDAPQKVEVFGLNDLMKLVRGGDDA